MQFSNVTEYINNAHAVDIKKHKIFIMIKVTNLQYTEYGN